MPLPQPEPPASSRAVSFATSLSRVAHSFLPRRHRTRRHEFSSSPSSPKSQHLQPQKYSSHESGRCVTHVTNICPQLDSHGLPIRRASSAISSDAFSPFLLLDHCGPHRVHAVRGEAPRCGQQELTYVLKGHVHMKDSWGHDTGLSCGAINLLTAGSGVTVSHKLNGPTVEYFSVWINIPDDMRNDPPKQRTTENSPCIYVKEGENAARIRVLAAPRKSSPINHMTTQSFGKNESVVLETMAGDAAVYDVHMQPKSQLVLNPGTERVFVYVYRGTAVIGRKTKVEEGSFAILEEKPDTPVVIDSYGVHINTGHSHENRYDDFDVFQENACWCLLLAGNPVSEPVSMLPSGIVAGTPQEIRRAFQEYTCGSLGASSPSPIRSMAAQLVDVESNDGSVDSLQFSEEGNSFHESDYEEDFDNVRN